MKLSVIIPVYNEQDTLVQIVRRARMWASRVSMEGEPGDGSTACEGEIVIVDDGSTDGTRAILADIRDEDGTIVVSHDRNRGKGAAVRTGIRYTSGDILLIQDADLEYDPADYPRLLEPILRGDAQVVYGSRFLRGRPAGMSPLNALGNRFLTAVANRLHRCSLTDMETCYKVFTREVATRLALHSAGWDFDPEVTTQILGLGYAIHEIPISYHGRTLREGKKIRWWHALSALGTLIRYWLSRSVESKARPLTPARGIAMPNQALTRV